MTERWRRELAGVDEISPNVEHIRARLRAPSDRPTPTGSGRSRLVAATTAIVVFVLAISLYVIPSLRGPQGSPDSSAPPAPSPSPLFVPGAPKSAAIAEAHKLLELAQIPPGSEKRSNSPIGALNYPPGGTVACSSGPCPYAIDVSGWWTVPMSMEDAIAWLQSHPPAGLFLNGDSSRGTNAVAWTYEDQPAPPYTRAELDVAVSSTGPNTSALRIDGQVLWMPPRSPAERIPGDVQQVEIAQRQGSDVVARQTLHGSAARELADLLNSLGRTNMGPPRCPIHSTKADNWTMTFPHSNGPYVFTAWTGCDSNPTVLVDVNGQPQPPLWDVWETSDGSGGGPVIYSPLQGFLECRFGDHPDPSCHSRASGSQAATQDHVTVFCSNLQQFGDWFSTAQEQSNGDEATLAASVQGNIGGVMMWFAPNAQAISDPAIRTEAEGIVTDTVALQTWTPTMSKSFTELLTSFSSDSGNFKAKYCA